MDELDELERRFEVEGGGNSTLHPFVGSPEDHVNPDIDGGNWEFVDWSLLDEDIVALGDALGAVRWDELSHEKQVDARAWPSIYADSVPEYPLLGRICSLFEDASYETSEIGPLDDECLRLQANSSVERAHWATNKLRVLCRKALARETGLILCCD